MSTLQIVSGSSLARPRSLLLVDEDRHAVDVVLRVAQRIGAIVRTVRSAEAALAQAAAESPSVLITSMDIGGRPFGVTLAMTIRRRTGAAVVLTGTSLAPQQATAIANINPDGFLCKPLRLEQAEATIRLALKRQPPAETSRSAEPARPDLAHALRQIAAVVNGTGVTSLAAEVKAPERLLASLRPREQEVVRLLFEHHRVPAIAAQLGISPETVRNHLKNVFRRVGAHSQQELLAYLRGSAPAAPEADHNPLHIVGG